MESMEVDSESRRDVEVQEKGKWRCNDLSCVLLMNRKEEGEASI